MREAPTPPLSCLRHRPAMRAAPSATSGRALSVAWYCPRCRLPPQVPLMGLVELIRGMQTSEETFEATQRLATHLGKTTCVSLVGPGFFCSLSFEGWKERGGRERGPRCVGWRSRRAIAHCLSPHVRTATGMGLRKDATAGWASREPLPPRRAVPLPCTAAHACCWPWGGPLSSAALMPDSWRLPCWMHPACPCLAPAPLAGQARLHRESHPHAHGQ